MAGLAAAALIGVGAAGVEKIKAHREKRKARRASIVDTETDADHSERENRFASSKAREASEERRRRIDEEEADARLYGHLDGPGPSRRAADATELGTHPALRRGGAVEVEAPPPYVKDAPSYEEHFSHALPEEPEASNASPPSNSPKSLSRRQRRRLEQDKYREFGALIRADGQQVNMAGVPLSQAHAPRERSPPRPGETEDQRRDRKRAEFFSLRRGSFYMFMGIGLVS